MNRDTLKKMKAATEARERFNATFKAELETRAANDDPRAKEYAEANAAIAKADEELRAALDAEIEAFDKQAADPKFRQVLDRVEVRHYLESSIEQRQLPKGSAEAEVAEERGYPDGVMPWDALLDDKDRLELRADADVAVIDAAKSKLRQEVIPRVFKRTDAAWCGIMMPTAPRGLPIYSVLTAGATGKVEEPAEKVDSETTTFTATQIAPVRRSASYHIKREDMAQFAELESVLRADLRMALGDLLDQTVVAADDSTDGNPGSIISHATAAPADPAAVAKLKDFDDAFAAAIDGLYAYERSGGRILIGVDTQKFLETTRHDEQATTYKTLLTSAGSEMRASARVAAAAANIQAAYRIVPAELRAYAPVWDGLEFIRDPYTDAQSGKIRLTAVGLFGFDIVRGTVTSLKFKLA